ncbi:ABC transporter permease [Saccharothrix violaceirubra]|uniref:Transport permease protein n=1 Tax=Saccharothrix violaceirubra TaxID=413306 RepID=A0A7W7WYQ2_9PSEU|nr:ABC transporter permease [Saccharothrix violaceirubra]MBB4967938.1 lipooligosaccharide transport system permease protein [Saccharothrix violaceirubra]
MAVVLGPVRAVLVCVEHRLTWYRRNWRASVVSNFLQPVLFLLALGLGFGSQVRPGPATGGLPYVEFLAPALLVVTALQATIQESTYAVLSALKWEKRYVGLVATPVTPAQVLYGHLVWIAAQSALATTAFLVVAALLGAVTSPLAVLAVPAAVLAGMAFSAPTVAFSVTREQPAGFGALHRFLVMPMVLFGGTYFPLDQLPDWLHPVVWLTPVWHGVELCRGLALGGLSPLAALGHVAYLAALVVLGTVPARRFFHRRLTQ